MQVIVLVGTGWSYMTPFLRDREKRILMVVIPLQVKGTHCYLSCQAGILSAAALRPDGVSAAPLATAYTQSWHTVL